MVSERKRKVRELESPYMKQHERQTQEALRRKKGVIRRLTFFGIIFIAVGVLAIVTIHAQGQVLNEQKERYGQLEQQLVQLEKDYVFLQEEIEHYNNLDYIAEIARRDYFLSKPGETIFKLPQSSTD